MPELDTLEAYARELARAFRDAELNDHGLIEMTPELRDAIVARLLELSDRERQLGVSDRMTRTAREAANGN